MEAGRELDALIAEKVMGCHVERDTSPSQDFVCACDSTQNPHADKLGWLKEYSTDIAAAWDVVERLELPFRLAKATAAMPNLVRPRGERYYAAFTRDFGDHPDAGGSTAPHAICLAALKTVNAL